MSEQETEVINIMSTTGFQPWGFHAIMDCSECDLVSIQDANNIKNWIADLLEKIDMQPIGEPIISKTGIGQADKEGYTAVQIIVTSSIVAHFIDRDRHIYIDVFSCKEFNPYVVEQSIKDFFGANTNIRTILLPRNAGVPVDM